MKIVQNENGIFDNQNLILFDDNSADVQPENKCNFLKPSREEEKDERTILRERLIQGNFIEKTSITNFLTNKI